MSLTPPPTVQKLQTALHTKAKAAPDYRFYALYDKVYRRDVLQHAYQCCRANKGSPGVDGQTFEAIESSGLGPWLDALTQSLRDRSYRPDPVKRVWLPKPGGQQRPLGIPTIRDRVVQTAAVLVLQGIFEADLPDEPYGYRPGKSALQAVEAVQACLDAG
jgi:retron-type reverse transcriptase